VTFKSPGRLILAPVLAAALGAGALALSTSASPAGEKGPPVPAEMNPSRLITQDQISQLREILKHEIVQISVAAQNKRHASLDEPSIIAMDKQWRAEHKAADKPLISATLSSPLSVYLLRMQARNGGLYSEIFIMANKGLNVGQSSIASDYWQGDEAKYKKTFLVGPDAVFVDNPEWHEGTKTWRSQVNMTIADNNGGRAIGAAVFEINLTEHHRRLGS
jgi:hypothetical protein